MKKRLMSYHVIMFLLILVACTGAPPSPSEPDTPVIAIVHIELLDEVYGIIISLSIDPAINEKDDLKIGMFILDQTIMEDFDIETVSYLLHEEAAPRMACQMVIDLEDLEASYFTQDLFALSYVTYEEDGAVIIQQASSPFQFNLYEMATLDEGAFAAHIRMFASQVIILELQITLHTADYTVTDIAYAKSYEITTDYIHIFMTVELMNHVVLDDHFKVYVNQKEVDFTYDAITHTLHIRIDDPNWTPAF